MRKKLLVLVPTISLMALSSTTAFAESDTSKSFEWYGALKLSVDNTDNGDESETSVNNHDSRFGLKGSQNIQEGLDVIYQIELGVDMAERSGINSGRNSFVGYKGSFGKVAVGQYDTPLKKVRGSGAVLFGDTIADSRTLISVAANGGGSQLDDRARNAIWWMSPKISNMAFFVMYSSDSSGSNQPDNNANELMGANVTFKEGPMYFGFGYQIKSSATAADDLEAFRIAASYKAGGMRFGGMFESSDNGSNDPMTRDAIIANAMMNVGDKSRAGVQVSMIDDYDGSSNTDATNVSLGFEHDYTKTTMVYVVGSFTQNGDNASFGLAQSGTGEAFRASADGKDAQGISAGIVQKF